MKRSARKCLLAAALLLVVLTLTGCGSGLNLSFNLQELYRLPKLPAKYTELNEQINAILESGAEYAAPLSGTDIQPVQMKDLDGDGREEAVAFFRSSGDEKPLKIYIFTAVGDSYEPSAIIEGSGTAIYSIAYSDMDRDGRTELAVGWRVTTELQALTIYALRPDGPRELIRTNYVKYDILDLDGDDFQELAVLRANEEGSSVAEYYGWQDGALALRSAGRLSMTMAELSQQGRVTEGTLRGGERALFVTGVTESALAITDVLTVRSGELTNVTLSDQTGVSTEIAPFNALYPADMNGDGVTEVPWPVAVPFFGMGEPTYQRIDWRNYDADGAAETVLSTWHDLEDGWYLRMPETWRDRVFSSRSVAADEAAVTFYIQDEEAPRPFLRVTAITGTNQEIKAVRGERFNLSRQGETTYVAELLEANETWAYGLTEDEVRSAFSLIAVEWATGDY